ncbi:MAG TPA: FlgD immunoglobulin-like domain containing protein [bacterium]|jgi:hypothetical protein|nr:FlgD immunoglobulin-like domain containing protein [bacterium]
MELVQAFFERDLSADEAGRLEALLQSDPAAAEAMLAQAQAQYRACGLPEPSWESRPRRGLPRGLFWCGGLLMAAGLAAAFLSDERTPCVPVAVWASGSPDREVALPAPAAGPRPAPAAVPPRPAAPPAAKASRQGRSLEVRLNLDGSGPVQVTVLDAGGRVRRDLFVGTLSSGEHALPWNGLDDAGRPVAPGEYQVVVASQGRRMVQSLRIKH